MTEKSIQDTYAPNLICFGCGPKNEYGLQLKSFLEGDMLVATWQGQEKHQAFEGMLNGGIIGSLLDCHCNWAASLGLMQQNGGETPPVCVTAEYSVKLHHPTPIAIPVQLRAWVEKCKTRLAVIRGEMYSGDTMTAECSGTFVAVKPDHPAYHRF